MPHHLHASPFTCLTIYMSHHIHVSQYTCLTRTRLTIRMSHHIVSPCTSHHIHASPFTCLTIYMSHNIHVSHVHASPYACLTMYVSPYTRLTIYMSHHLHVSPYTCLTIYMSHHIHVSYVHISPYTCLTIYMSHHVHQAAENLQVFVLNCSMPFPSPYQLRAPHLTIIDFHRPNNNRCRSLWQCGLRLGSAAARLLGLRVRNLPGAWMFISCECCVVRWGFVRGRSLVHACLIIIP